MPGSVMLFASTLITTLVKFDPDSDSLLVFEVKLS